MGGAKSTVSNNAADAGIKSQEDVLISSTAPQQKKLSTSVAEPPQPPRSARTLLEVQLNPDAPPFAPKLGSLGSVGPQQDLPPCQAQKAQPEWMQYLASKFEARKDATLASAPKKPTTGEIQRQRQQTVPREKLKFGTRGQGLAAASLAPEAGIEQQGTGIILHTSEYLRLLKDGGNKSKRIPNSSTIDRRSQGSTRSSASLKGLGLSQDRPNAPPLEAPLCRAGGSSGSEGDPHATTETLPLLASPGLAKLWSTTLMADPVAKLAGDRVHVGAATRPLERDGVDAPSATQDDIWVDKSRADMDLSQPDAYWSEDEGFVRTRVRSWNGPSAHALGRRPRAAAADIRTYVMQDLSTNLDRLVALFLHRLQRFSDLDRTVFHPEGSSGKRYIIGIKEVVRRMKQQKVTHLIVAPDITENSNEGGLDDRMREIIAQAYENEIPVVFALSRSRMGRAVGKSMHISLVGVVDATGARDLLDPALRLSREQCHAWLARTEKATRQKTSPGADPSPGGNQRAASLR